MAICGVLLDLDGTLLKPGTTLPQPGIPEFIADLKRRDLVVNAMTSRPANESNLRLLESGLDIDDLHCAGHEGCKAKPGGTLVARFCGENDLERHEVLVIGDDRTGVFEALNGRAFGFHATWGGVECEYGIHVGTPEEFLDYLDVFFMKKTLWYSKRTDRDVRGRPVVFRARIDANGAGSETVKSAILRTLKDKSDARVNGVSMSSFVMMHMIASAYLEGLLSVDRKQALWQIYPGHSVTSTPPPLIRAAVRGFKIVP